MNPRPPNSPGVYLFLGDLDAVMYVGMAHDLEKVLYRYKGLKGRQQMRDRLADGLFSRVAWLICTQPETAPTLERIAITAFRPPWNDQHNPRPRTPATVVRLVEDRQRWLGDVERDLSDLVARHTRIE